MLFLPVFLRGLGMLVLIIAFALFAVEELNPKFLLANAFFLICFRSVLAPILATSFYSNTLYRLEKIHVLPVRNNQSDQPAVPPANSLSPSHSIWHKGTNILKLHKSGYPDTLCHSTAAKPSAFAQAHIRLSVCHLTGHSHCFTCFIPFHKTIRVRCTKAGDDMV